MDKTTLLFRPVDIGMGCPMLVGYQGCHGKQIGRIRDLYVIVTYGLAGTVVVWWDDLHYWSPAVEGHMLFKKGKVGR